MRLLLTYKILNRITDESALRLQERKEQCTLVGLSKNVTNLQPERFSRRAKHKLR